VPYIIVGVLTRIGCCFQLARDFVDDCKHQVEAYFNDSKSFVTDTLAEDILHHASVLARCNAANTALRLIENAGIDPVPHSANPDASSGPADIAPLFGIRCFAKGAITSKIKHALKLKTSPARLAQLLHNCCSPH